MISVLIFCHKKKEADILHKLCGCCAALTGDEAQVTDLYGSSLGAQMEKGTGRVWDLLIFEMSSSEDISEAARFRKLYPESAFMIITEPEISPEWYVTPELCPTLLLLKPLDRPRAMEAIRRMMAYCYEQREKEAYTHSLVVRSGEERRYFRYTQILFLEAREKKLILYSGQEKLAFYGSLREMERVLPEYFIRCHRSYIVNFMHISKLNISQGVLHIHDQFVIPVSKKYKANVNILLESGMEDKREEGTTERRK